MKYSYSFHESFLCELEVREASSVMQARSTFAILLIMEKKSCLLHELTQKLGGNLTKLEENEENNDKWINIWQLIFPGICLQRQGEGGTVKQAKEAACAALINAPEVHSLVSRKLLFQRTKSKREQPGESQGITHTEDAISTSTYVSSINDICQGSWEWKLKDLDTEEIGQFRTLLKVEGIPIAEGCGRSKNEAENNAAKKALEHSVLEADLTVIGSLGLDAEMIERLCEEKFHTLLGDSLQLKMDICGSGAVFSCILMTCGHDRSQPEIVALTSGSKIFSGKLTDLEGSRGRIITDCHAEILARRAFGAYLHDQAMAAISIERSEAVLQMDFTLQAN